MARQKPIADGIGAGVGGWNLHGMAQRPDPLARYLATTRSMALTNILINRH